MDERDRMRDERLNELFARTRAHGPALAPDPDLAARIGAMLRGSSVANPGARLRQPRWAWASFVTAAFVAAAVGGYVGYRAGTASQTLTSEEVRDAEVFLTALSQTGFVDDLSRLETTDDEVQE